MISPYDEFEIHALFTRYAACLDSGDVDGLVECFTADAVLESPTTGASVGHEAIRAFGLRYARFREAGTQMRHLVFNLAVVGEGDEADVTSYLLITHTTRNETVTQPVGRYLCRVVRVDGRWLFRRRLVIMDAEPRMPKV